MIIGLSGLIGSGKNTAASLIKEAYPEKNFENLSFARTLKDAVSVMFGWDRKMLEGDTNESRTFRITPDSFWSDKFGYQVTPRGILQKFGNEAKNYFCEDFWSASGVQRVIEHNPDKNFLITDVRYPDEIKYLTSVEALLIEVQRGEEPEWYYQAKRVNKGKANIDEFPLLKNIHVSEWKWIGLIPNKVYNNGTLDDLQEQLTALIVKHYQEK